MEGNNKTPETIINKNEDIKNVIIPNVERSSEEINIPFIEFNKNKESKIEKALNLIPPNVSGLTKAAVVGVGLFLAGNNLGANNNTKNKIDKVVQGIDNISNIKEDKSKAPNGVNIEEVIVYGKKKYKEELNKQQENIKKFEAEMAKYEKDSIKWVEANQEYSDKLKLYNEAKKEWNKEQQFRKEFIISECAGIIWGAGGYIDKETQKERNKSLDKDLSSFNQVGETKTIFISEEEAIKLAELSKTDGSVLDNYIKEYINKHPSLKNIKIEEHLKKELLDFELSEEKRTIFLPYDEAVSLAKLGKADTAIWPSYSDATKKRIKDNKNFKPYFVSINSDGHTIGIYEKPKNISLTPPIKPTEYKVPEIIYNSIYENLSMRSLWPTILKQNPNEKIGTLHVLDTQFKEGFTLEEAMAFPQEIKDTYNIDYIYNQIHGAEKSPTENYIHPGWGYNNPEK